MENNYRQTALEARKKVLSLIYKAQVSHIGSNFSCIDIMSVVFGKINFEKDIFCLSKGWAAASLYYFLWRRGRLSLEDLDSFCMPNSKYIGLAEPVHSDIKIAGGSMGLSFPGAVGLALAKKLKGEGGMVYCLMSDGEMQIGTTWESALIANKYKLDNLIVYVDRNYLQAMGDTEDILPLESLVDKWKAFGWFSKEIDGHDYEALERTTADFVRPRAFICNTTKGKGVDFMEGVNLYHYKQLSEDEYNRAKLCLK